MTGIKINNLQFSYGTKEVFKNLNFVLPTNKTLSIIGSRGSGKTTLLRLLDNDLSCNGSISINDIVVNDVNFDSLSKMIKVVFSDFEIYEKKVLDELLYFVKLYDFEEVKIDLLLDELGDFFSLFDLFDKSVDDLSLSDTFLIKILSYALLSPSYLVLDDLLCFLDLRTKVLLLNYLNSKGILLINVTSDMEEVLYTDYVLCLYQGISAIDGEVFSVLKHEKLLKRLGFSLPFMVDVSIQLQLYGLIDKLCLNKEDMVKELWK